MCLKNCILNVFTAFLVVVKVMKWLVFSIISVVLDMFSYHHIPLSFCFFSKFFIIWFLPPSPYSSHPLPFLSLSLVPIPPCFLLPYRLLPWQSKVLVSVSVTSPDLFHVVLRYANWGGSHVRGRVSVIEDAWNYYCGNCKCWEGTNMALFFSLPSLEWEE